MAQLVKALVQSPMGPEFESQVPQMHLFHFSTGDTPMQRPERDPPYALRSPHARWPPGQIKGARLNVHHVHQSTRHGELEKSK